MISESDASSFRTDLFARLDESLEAAEPEKYTVPEVKRERGWDAMTWPKEGEWEKAVDTGVAKDVLLEVGKRSVTIDKSVVSACVDGARACIR